MPLSWGLQTQFGQLRGHGDCVNIPGQDELRGKNSPKQVSAERLPQKGATIGTFWALALGKVDLYSKLGKQSNSI